MSGVGIWSAIGLASPESTSTLIHNFVFGWAMEGRVSNRMHLTLGWMYAGTSFCTLVIINGILTFMLTPGKAWLAVAGTGREASEFWQAFFNPTYWPSLELRTECALRSRESVLCFLPVASTGFNNPY